MFADIGVPDPELMLAKAKLALNIERLIEERGLTRAKAAKLLGLKPTELANLFRGLTRSYKLDRLFMMLYALGQEVEVTVRPAAK